MIPFGIPLFPPPNIGVAAIVYHVDGYPIYPYSEPFQTGDGSLDPIWLKKEGDRWISCQENERGAMGFVLMPYAGKRVGPPGLAFLPIESIIHPHEYSKKGLQRIPPPRDHKFY